MHRYATAPANLNRDVNLRAGDKIRVDSQNLVAVSRKAMVAIVATTLLLMLQVVVDLRNKQSPADVDLPRGDPYIQAGDDKNRKDGQKGGANPNQRTMRDVAVILVDVIHVMAVVTQMTADAVVPTMVAVATEVVTLEAVAMEAATMADVAMEDVMMGAVAMMEAVAKTSQPTNHKMAAVVVATGAVGVPTMAGVAMELAKMGAVVMEDVEMEAVRMEDVAPMKMEVAPMVGVMGDVLTIHLIMSTLVGAAARPQRRQLQQKNPNLLQK